MRIKLILMFFISINNYSFAQNELLKTYLEYDHFTYNMINEKITNYSFYSKDDSLIINNNWKLINNKWELINYEQKPEDFIVLSSFYKDKKCNDYLLMKKFSYEHKRKNKMFFYSFILGNDRIDGFYSIRPNSRLLIEDLGYQSDNQNIISINSKELSTVLRKVKKIGKTQKFNNKIVRWVVYLIYHNADDKIESYFFLLDNKRYKKLFKL